MTIEATYKPTRQQGNGKTTEFSYDFYAVAPEYLKVLLETNGIQEETQDYTATITEKGGIVTMNIAPTAEQWIIITRSTPANQEVPYKTSAGFDAEVIENSFDKLTAMVQENKNAIDRSPKLPEGYNKDVSLPVPEAGKTIIWNEKEDGFRNSIVNIDDVTEETRQYRDEAEQFAINSEASAVRSEASAIRSETAAQSAETAVNGFDAHVEDSKITIDQFTGMKIDDIDSHAAIKEQEFNTNAAEKQAQVDTSANNANVSELKAKASELNSKESERRASVWAEGTDSEVASLGGEKSAKGWANKAAEIVGKGVIQDDVISLTTTYSSDKLEKLLAVNEDHDSVLDCLDVLDTNIGAKTTVPLSSLLAIDSDARPSHKAKGAEVYDEFGTMGIIDSVTPTEAVIITKESREKVRIVDTLDIQKNGLDQYFVDLNSNQIRNEIIKGKIVQLRFDDVITNTGEQLYPFETFDKDGYAVFRRNVISADKAERINIKVDYQGIVTFDTVTLQAGSGSVIGDIHYTSRTTVPEGGVWCDGSEITEAQNPKFYKMLVDGEILSTTYTAYNASVASNGSCGFFGLDTVAKAFKVPTLKDVYLKVGTPETFNAESLPNIKGTVKTLDPIEGTGAFSGTDKKNVVAFGEGVIVGKSFFDAHDSTPTYQDNAKVNPDNVTYRAYVIVSNKSDTTIDIKHEVQLNNPFFFGMYHFFESEPNNASWLLSNGNFHSGDTYKGFYQWLVSAQATPIEGVSVKLSTEAYTEFDYVINNGNSTFRLPLKVKGASGSAVKGNGLTLGLTNGTINTGLSAGQNAFFVGYSNDYGKNVGTANSGNTSKDGRSYGITSEADKSGIVTATDGLKLYFYVGETVQDANMILAGRALEDLSKKLDRSNKAEISGWAMPSEKYIDIDVGNVEFTAPANGLVQIRADNNSGGYLTIRNKNTQYFEVMGAGGGIVVHTQVRKGDTTFYENVKVRIFQYRFIYAEGDK